MTDFSYLNSFDVDKTKTSLYKVFQIEMNGKTPELDVLPATQANERYFNALLSRSQRIKRQVEAGKFDVELLSDNREEDKLLYPVHVIKGWRNVYDSSGQAVAFDTAACADFIKALPNWIFDDLTLFCRTPQNFVETTSVDLEEVGNDS